MAKSPVIGVSFGRVWVGAPETFRLGFPESDFPPRTVAALTWDFVDTNELLVLALDETTADAMRAWFALIGAAPDALSKADKAKLTCIERHVYRIDDARVEVLGPASPCLTPTNGRGPTVCALRLLWSRRPRPITMPLVREDAETIAEVLAETLGAKSNATN